MFIGDIHRIDFDPLLLGAKCGECPMNGRKPVPPKGPQRPRMVVLGEGPGGNEVVAGEPFVGKSGAVLDAICTRNHILRESLYLTNATKCMPPKGLGKAQLSLAVKCCRPLLYKELGSLDSRFVLALGGRALQAMTGKDGIFSWMGGPEKGKAFDGKGAVLKDKDLARGKLPEVDFRGYGLIPSLHPAYGLREPWWLPVIEIHTMRALGTAEGRVKPFVWPEIIVEPGRLMDSALIALRHAAYVGCDSETTAKNPMEAEILNVGLSSLDVAVSVPWPEASTRTRALTRSVILNSSSLSGQNFQYDIVAFTKSGIPVSQPLRDGRYPDRSRLRRAFKAFDFDTLPAHRVIAPQLKHNLATQMAIESNADRWKDDFKVGHDTGGATRFLNADPYKRGVYNAKDSFATEFLRPIYESRLASTHNGRALFAEYMQMIWLAVDMQIRGVAVHRGRLATHDKAIGDRRDEALKSVLGLASKAGMANYLPSSYQQTVKLFESLGAKSSKRTGSDAPCYDASVLIDFATRCPDATIQSLARALLTYRRWHKLYSTYISGMKVDGCGLVHPSWNTSGAKTGRWSSNDPNLMNIPHPKYDLARDGTKTQTTPGLHDLFGAWKED